MKKYT